MSIITNLKKKFKIYSGFEYTALKNKKPCRYVS